MKKFTKGEENLITKFSLRLSGDPLEPNKSQVRYNPVSGASVNLNPFCATLYDRVIDQYNLYLAGNYKAVHWYDRLKYLLLKIDQHAYMELID